MTILSPFGFFVTTLAIWRCVVFVQQDSMIDGVRHRVTVALNSKDTLVRQKLYTLLIVCEWCLSIWFSAAAVVAWACTTSVGWVEGVMLWLAMATLAAVANQLSDKL